MNKGFTLVELLIVIAILGVLSASVVLVLNPAELLRQARDSTRVSDMSTLNSAMSLYLTDVTSPDMNADAGDTIAGDGLGNNDCNTKYYVAVSPTTNSFASGTRITAVPVLGQGVNGAGWLPIKFTDIPGTGSPIGSLPLDSTNSGDFVYRYACDNANKRYEIDAKFESTKYVTTLGLPSKDGGDQATFYEVGNDPGLDL